MRTISGITIDQDLMDQIEYKEIALTIKDCFIKDVKLGKNLSKMLFFEKCLFSECLIAHEERVSFHQCYIQDSRIIVSEKTELEMHSCMIDEGYFKCKHEASIKIEYCFFAETDIDIPKDFNDFHITDSKHIAIDDSAFDADVVASLQVCRLNNYLNIECKMADVFVWVHDWIHLSADLIEEYGLEHEQVEELWDWVNVMYKKVNG